MFSGLFFYTSLSSRLKYVLKNNLEPFSKILSKSKLKKMLLFVDGKQIDYDFKVLLTKFLK